MPTRVFLSYARADDELFVRKLHDDLTKAGLTVWFDRVSMPARGLHFSREIADAIEAADRLLLVVGPGALTSAYVQAEWRQAMAVCKPVHPLLRLADYSDIPAELKGFDARDFRDDAKCVGELKTLLRQLGEPAVGIGALVGVPELPQHYRPRPDDLGALKKIALANLHRPVALVGTHTRFGPLGAGGRGKTTLAAALARDCEIRSAFPDGVFRVELGSEPSLVSLQAELARSLCDTGPAFTEVNVGRARLSTLLANRSCLLVLDNVWDQYHAWCFASDTLGPKCRALITTRDAGVLKALGAEAWNLDVLHEGEALSLLASCADWQSEMPPEAAEVARECHGEPHSLVTIGGAARGIPNPWPDLLNYLRDSDRSVIRHRLVGDPRWEMLRPIEISVQALPEPLRARYLELAVFPRGAAIPDEVILTLWKPKGLHGFPARKALRDLADRSLLQRDAHGRISLHDHNFDYLQAMADDLPALHATLIGACRGLCPAGWHAGPNDGYFYQNLPYHLLQAGRSDELRALLLDYQWMQAKLDACGIVALLDDYRLLPGDPVLELVAGALRLSAHVVARKPRQLAGQLVGRLIGKTVAELQLLCCEAEQLAPRPCLIPRTPTLAAPGGALMRTLEGHNSAVTTVALTADGMRVVMGLLDNTIRVLDLETGRNLMTLEGHTNQVNAVALTLDGKRAISGSDDNTLKVWDLETGREITTLSGHSDRVTTVAVTADGTHAVSGSMDNTLIIWDMETGRGLMTLSGHANWVFAVALTADGKTAVSGSEDNTLKVWDLETGRELQTLEGHTDSIYAVALSADGKRAVSGSRDHALKVWDVQRGCELTTLSGHSWAIRAVALAVDGRRAISGSEDNTLKVWDIENGRELCALYGHIWGVRAVALSVDGTRAISGSDDKTLKLWDLETAHEQEPLSRHSNFVSAVALTSKRRLAVSGSGDNTLKVWDLVTGRELRSLAGHSSRVSAVALNADGTLAVSASFDGTLKVWDLQTGIELSTLDAHGGFVTAVALTASGMRAISGSDDGKLRVWDMMTSREVYMLEGHSDSINAVAVTANGTRAVSASDDKTLKAWDLNTRRELTTLSGHYGAVTAVALTVHGARAVSASNDGTLKVYDLETGSELQTLAGHSDSVLAVALTADETRAISGSWDCTIGVWDLEGGGIVTEFTTENPVFACNISTDGKTIVAGDEFGWVHFLSYLE